MNKKIKILHLEDSQKDSELIHSIIKSGGIKFDYFLADNEQSSFMTGQAIVVDGGATARPLPPPSPTPPASATLPANGGWP